MTHWTDNMIAREPAPRATEPRIGGVYWASTIYGLMFVYLVDRTRTHLIVRQGVAVFSLRRSETTLYLRQPTRTN